MKDNTNSNKKSNPSSKQAFKQMSQFIKSPPKTDDEEVLQMFERMREMKRDLEDQLADIQSKGRRYNLNIENYFGDIYQLTPQQLEKLQAEKQVLNAKISQAISKAPESSLQRVPKTEEKMTQERKSKLRGARKNWIPLK